jgi:hypothetical protein
MEVLAERLSQLEQDQELEAKEFQLVVLQVVTIPFNKEFQLVVLRVVIISCDMEILLRGCPGDCKISSWRQNPSDSFFSSCV